MCYVGRWDIPWFTRSSMCNGKKLDITITYFWEKVFDHNHDLVLDNRYHQPGDSVAESVTLFFMQQLFNASWAFVFIGNYIITTDGWMAVPTIAYIFPEGRFNLGGLRAEVGYKAYGRQAHKIIKTGYDHMDSIILRLRYEF